MWLAATLSCGLCLGLAEPHGGEVGHVRVRNFTPREYAADGQNWAVVQDERGVLLVGNNGGLLEHDGETWRTIKVPHPFEVRSLARSSSGRVFVGLAGDFGYLRPAFDGSQTYVSLRHRGDGGGPDFNYVQAIVCLGDDIFFQTERAVFRLRDGRLTTWEHDQDLQTMFTMAGRLYLWSSDAKLLELRGDALATVPVRGAQVVNVSVVLSAEAGRALIGTDNDGLFFFDFTRTEGDSHEVVATPWVTEADELVRRSTLYCGVRLMDGSYALGTNLAGVVIVDPHGRIVRRIDVEEGLENQEIQKIYQDQEGNLWLALNNGLAWVDLASGLSHWDKTHGLKNIVTAAERFAGHLYVTSFDGLHRLVGTRVVSVPGLVGAATCLERFDPPGEPDRPILLAGSSEVGVCEVRGDQAVPIPVTAALRVVCLHQSQRDPTRLYIGTSEGLSIATFEGRRWLLSETPGTVEDFVEAIAEDDNGDIWFSTTSLGAYRLEQGRPVRFGRASGLPEDTGLRVFSLQGRLVITTAGGLYQLDASRRRFEPSSWLAGAYQGRQRVIQYLLEDSSGRVWAQGKEADGRRTFIGVAVPGPGAASRWVEECFRPLESVILISLTVEPDRTVWIATYEGLYRYRGNLDVPSTELAALVREAAFGLDDPSGHPTPGAVPPYAAGRNVLPYRRGSVRFVYAAPTWSGLDGAMYRTSLEGFDSGWSGWLRDTKREYTNLRERSYRFRVQARNVYGQITREAVCELTILAPWYRTWWAYLGYATLATGLLWAFVALNTARLGRAKVRLERIVEERTAQVVAQKQEIEVKNREITDSIVYASRIQQAMLPPESLIAELTESHFILYRPRDIVSGDFYWFKRVGRHVFLVAGDCTGHGVPGAFMSVLSISLLNEIVAGVAVCSPQQILGRLRERIVESLRQSEAEGSTRDGLDITLCVVDLDSLTLQYSGAHQPLWLFRGTATGELVEIRGDRMPVGFHPRRGSHAFSAHEVQLARGDTLYLFTDGLASQLGGPDRATFKVSRLREALCGVQGKPLAEQREALERTLAEWMAGEEQVDDILVMGVRV